MPVSVERIERHIEEWGPKLGRDSLRKSWPKYLFHTLDASSINAVVARGAVLSRQKVVSQHGAVICDVANQGALWSNPAAHNYVRLYFRPRNSYHLKNEGIKSLSDVYRIDPHMTIPVTIAFNISPVLSLPGAAFVPGNFARLGNAPCDTDEDFDDLSFSDIYHDSAPPQARMSEILNARMSEVVVASEVSLSHARGLVVRNSYDRWTLRHLLSDLPEDRCPKILLDREGAVFFKRGMYIRDLYLEGNDILLRFGEPFKAPQSKYKIRIEQDKKSVEYFLEAKPLWRISDHDFDLAMPVKVLIEDCLAFHASLPEDASVVV